MRASAEASSRPAEIADSAFWWRCACLCSLLTLVIYGRNLADGFLADDFLLIAWSRQGWWTLLRHFTVDSYPQVIRLWPVLFWVLTSFGHAPVWLHTLSLVLHALNGSLVGLLAWRRSRSVATSLFVSAAFVALPLFGEPVIWLGCSFDLWACLFALLALLAIDHEAPWYAAALYAVGLLSKESIFTLPFIALVAVRPAKRSSLLPMGTLAAVYLVARLLLFHGIGGYSHPETHNIPVPATPWSVARTLFFNLPYLLLIPVRGAIASRVPLAALSVSLAVPVFMSWRAFGRAKHMVMVAATALLAALPALPALGLASDLSGGRMFYFPAAIAAFALVNELGPLPHPVSINAALLVVFWMAASAFNGRAWAQAATEVHRDLDGLKAVESRFPAGARVLVDIGAMRDGACLFAGVGLSEAARWRGLRADVEWLRGTTATLEEPALTGLGRNLFTLDFDGAGQPRDWSACDAALLGTPHADMLPVKPAGPRRWTWHVPPDAVGLRIGLPSAACGPDTRVSGLLFARRPDEPFFTLGGSRYVHFAPPHCATFLRIPAEWSSLDTLEMRLDLERVVTGDSELVRVSRVARDALPACSAVLLDRN